MTELPTLYGYTQAAEKLAHLGITKTWLQRHIKKIPHIKLGRTVFFTDEDLARIPELFRHEPKTGPLAATSSPVTSLRPRGRRRATA
jgi:hypothetical protein